MKPYMKTVIWLVIFSIAMGYIESAIVIYLRKIYYPGGFQFPLVALDTSIGLVEIFREAATIIMLLGIGILTAKQLPRDLLILFFALPYGTYATTSFFGYSWDGPSHYLPGIFCS
jgi:hypothetical protein